MKNLIGIAIIISDFMTDSNWKKAVDYLRYKKRQVLLLQILTPEELEPTYTGRVNLIDSESLDIADPRNMKLRINSSLQSAYQMAIEEFRKDIYEFSKKRDVDYIEVDTTEAICTNLQRVTFSDNATYPAQLKYIGGETITSLDATSNEGGVFEGCTKLNFVKLH